MNHWRLNIRQKTANNNLLNELKEAVPSSELVGTVLSLMFMFIVVDIVLNLYHISEKPKHKKVQLSNGKS